MRLPAVILAMGLACATPARADDPRLDWPLRPHPPVVRTFDAPAPDWN
ncbi:MAG: M23 family peptidase, partial [Mycobacterium sp.]